MYVHGLRCLWPFHTPNPAIVCAHRVHKNRPLIVHGMNSTTGGEHFPPLRAHIHGDVAVRGALRGSDVVLRGERSSRCCKFACVVPTYSSPSVAGADNDELTTPTTNCCVCGLTDVISVPSFPSSLLCGPTQVGWDIRVYLPTFIYIGSHILGPFVLNPVIMRGYY